MLFVGTSIIHPSTEGVFLLCNILDLLIYRYLFKDKEGIYKMKILLAVVGGLLLLIFPFIVMKKAKVTKEENTDEARKKFNVFLICMIPVPLIGFIFLLIGLRSFL